MNTLVVDSGPLVERVALLKEGILDELYIEEKTENRLLGSIYKGRVVNVLPGMQSAFVDIGLKKNAYIHIKDLVPFENKREGTKDKRIQDYIKSGQELFVQVVKVATGDKGPKVTTNITLKGRYAILSPMEEFVGVSKKITDSRIRDALKDLVDHLLPDAMGCVVRTEAGSASESLIINDINYLLQLWHKIKREIHLGKTPRLIFQDFRLPLRILRDRELKHVDVIKVDQEEVRDELETYLKHHLNDHPMKLILTGDSSRIFENEGVERQILELMQKEIRLPKGGSIIIEETHALTSIDVNTGKYVGEGNSEETFLKINLDAADEIMRQIKIRNISGIIVIDFIDMKKSKHLNAVMNRLKKWAEKDPVKMDVYGFTKLGLMEISRQKKENSILKALYKPCFSCGGEGSLPSELFVTNKLFKEIERITEHTDSEAAVFQMDAKTFDYLNTKSLISVSDIHRVYGIKAIFDVKEDIERCFFKLKFMGRLSDVGKFTKS